MSFLVPNPIERHIRTKSKQNYGSKSKNGSIFDKIRSLCRPPNPVVERLDERLFVSTIFDDIRELCRRPDLLTTIEEFGAEEQKSNNLLVEPKVYKKRKIQNYTDSNESNSSEIIIKSKLFSTLVRGNPNQRVDQLVNNCINENINKTNEKTNKRLKNNVNKTKKSPKKRSSVKCSKSEDKLVRRRKPLLSIDFDITSKINEYSKQYSEANKTCKKRKYAKKSNPLIGSETDSCTESSDFGVCSSYESMVSPQSTCQTMSYSMPATPISSVDSFSSDMSSETTSSVLSQIRKSLNPKFETYRQYFQRCSQNQSKLKTTKRNPKQELHFKEKVLQWSDKICLGNTTPVHNIEYLATPPGSPQKTSDDIISTSNELNAMIESLENIETTDKSDTRFDELMEDLFSDFI